MPTPNRKSILVLLTAMALTVSLAPAATAGHRPPVPAPARAGAVTFWSSVTTQAALDACLAPTNNPLHESRMYAVVHIAIHDALNAIDRRSDPYAFATPREVSGASPDAAIATAARDVLVALLGELPPPFAECAPTAVAGVEDAYRTTMQAIPAGTSKDRGARLGAAAAGTILALRSGDGSDTQLFDAEAPQGTTPGVYRSTDPFTFVFAPGWADVTPFALKDSSQFGPGKPYKLTSSKYARDLEEVRRLGRDVSSERTSDQTEIAAFWYESAPLQWNRIARTVTTATRGLTAWDHARLFGLLNVALADGYIGTFQTKRDFYRWRPVTAIQLADTDGNPATTGDPTWTPLLVTPPIPSYDSAHSVEGAAAAEVMRRFFGTDRRAFTTCSLTVAEGATCNGSADPGGVYRAFDSFTEAADENGLSRILAGIHFRQDVAEGLRHGRRIGARTVTTLMRRGG